MDQAGTSLVAHAREDNSYHDPFEVLRIANNTITQNIRREEVSPDLKKQLTQTGMSASAQAYFCEPYMNSYLGPQVRRRCENCLFLCGRQIVLAAECFSSS